jgi:transcription antitermination factor NusG
MELPSKAESPDVRWYAVWTKSRQEKAAAARLSTVGVSHYLPLRSELRQWSDRKQTVHSPLFPGYLFVQLDVCGGGKLEVLKAPGVVGFVGNLSGPLPIPENQIESVRKAASYGEDCCSRPLLNQGDRVRVIRGALAGIEGTLQRHGAKSQLIIAIEMIQRSVVVTVSEEDVEPAICPN